MNNIISITGKEGYRAMYYFLENYLKLVDSEDIKELLGSMSLLPDGSTADPGCEKEWQEAIARSKIDLDGVNLKFIDKDN